MRAELIFAPESEEDILQAYDWYEAQRPGLGGEFISSIESCVETLRAVPEMYSTVFHSYRRALLSRFPYGVFYEFDGVTVTIYGIFHAARDPKKWRLRLK